MEGTSSGRSHGYSWLMTLIKLIRRSFNASLDSSNSFLIFSSSSCSAASTSSLLWKLPMLTQQLLTGSPKRPRASLTWAPSSCFRCFRHTWLTQKPFMSLADCGFMNRLAMNSDHGNSNVRCIQLSPTVEKIHVKSNDVSWTLTDVRETFGMLSLSVHFGTFVGSTNTSGKILRKAESKTCTSLLSNRFLLGMNRESVS